MEGTIARYLREQNPENPVENERKFEKLSSLARKHEKKQIKNLLGAALQADARLKTLMQIYPKALTSAFIVGQALQSPPEGPNGLGEVENAMATLIELTHHGLVPPEVQGGMQALDKKLAEKKPPVHSPGTGSDDIKARAKAAGLVVL